MYTKNFDRRPRAVEGAEKVEIPKTAPEIRKTASGRPTAEAAVPETAKSDAALAPSAPQTAKSDGALSPNAPKATILGRVRDRFSLFFEVVSRGRLDSQREEPHPCFCWQARYFQGFADYAEKPKINQNQRIITLKIQ